MWPNPITHAESTADATRLVGEAYRTRLARSAVATPADKTRIAQEG